MKQDQSGLTSRKNGPTPLLYCLAVMFFLASCGYFGRIEGPNYQDSFYLDAKLVAAKGKHYRQQHRDRIAHSIILIGDAGSPAQPEAVLETLHQWANQAPERTTVVYLGDNLYKDGLELDDYQRGRGVLAYQLDHRAAKVVIGGNHDWGSSNIYKGWPNLKRQQAYVDSQATADFRPKEGCPGPDTEVVVKARPPHKGLSLIALDTQWWLQRRPWKPWHLQTPWDQACGQMSQSEAIAQFEAELEKRQNDFVLVLGHHPLVSSGKHGGYKRKWRHNIAKWLVARNQDIGSPRYANMSRKLQGAMAKYKPLISAAGHDHSLQVMRGGTAVDYMVVSGAGSSPKITPVTALAGTTLFAHGHGGFMVIDLIRHGDTDEVLLSVVEPGADNPVLSVVLNEGGVESRNP